MQRSPVFFLLGLSFLGGVAQSALVNDVCSGAISLSNGISYAMSTTNATSVGDPGATCSILGSGVWFSMTPGTSGLASIQTCGSDFDTVMQVFTGTCEVMNP